MKDVSVSVPEINERRTGGAVVLGVRPEHIRFSDAATLRGRVFGAEYLGTTQIVTVVTEQGTIKARVPSGMPVQVGETVGLSFRFNALSLFDAQTGMALQTANQPSMNGESAAHG